MKIAAGVCILVLSASSALARTSTTAPAEDTPEAARQLFVNALTDFDASPRVTIIFTEQENWSELDRPKKPSHQESFNQVFNRTHQLTFERPARLRYTRTESDGSTVNAIYDGARYLDLYSSANRPPSGLVGDAPGRNINDLLEANEPGIELWMRDIAPLLCGDVRNKLLPYTTDWKWLGSSTAEHVRCVRVAGQRQVRDALEKACGLMPAQSTTTPRA